MLYRENLNLHLNLPVAPERARRRPLNDVYSYCTPTEVRGESHERISMVIDRRDTKRLRMDEKKIVQLTSKIPF